MVKKLMDEYNLEIDDIRWYLSMYTVDKIKSLMFDKKEAARYIWSGELEAFLYNMEEKFVEDLNDQINRNLMDEARLRELMQEIKQLKRNREKN